MTSRTRLLTFIALVALVGLAIARLVGAPVAAPAARAERNNLREEAQPTAPIVQNEGKEPAETQAVDASQPLLPDLALDELLKPVAAKEPAEALGCLATIRGFRMELVAHEPDVVDPVAAAFDEQGRLYVAEMRDYPFRPADGEKPTGRIRMLSDADGDGRFDESFDYADELLWPTGIVPFRGGVFVAAAPHIYYLKDTDGDGRSDERRIVFSGFGTQNEQGSVNNLAWGLDGRIYASSSKNGGRIVTGDNPQAEPVAINGRDFCFDPETGKFELVTGGGQFGNAFDDWGRRFLCDESDPSIHVMLPHRYLARNPLLAVPEAVDDLTPGVTPIFRASPLEGWRIVRSTRRLALGERSPQSSGLSHHVLDGVAGLMIYRGDAFPPEFVGQIIVGDGQNNVIHRRRLEPAGVSFRSLRADDGEEFVRSTDNWFRPVNAINAPDGTVYVTDMAREVIESVHVPWDVVGRMNLKSQGRGRIYRIAPVGFTPRPPPQLGTATSAELVAALAHRSGWWRDTAQRLLRERQDPESVAAVRELLRSTDRGTETELGRLHALYTLDQLHALEGADLVIALGDASAGVREHAVLLAEQRLAASPALLARVLELADDEAPRVRLQVAFSLGELDVAMESDRVAAGLARIARRDGGDPWVRTAVLSSSYRRAAAVILQLGPEGLAARGSAGAEDASPAQRAPLLRQLGFFVGRDENHAAEAPSLLAALGERVVSVSEGDHAAEDSGGNNGLANVAAVVLGVSDGLRGAGSSLHQLRGSLSSAAVALVDRVVDDAAMVVVDEHQDVKRREQASLVLSCGDFQRVRDLLAGLLVPTQPEAIQRGAIQSLATFDEPAVGGVFIRAWRQVTPAVRQAMTTALFARPQWVAGLVAALEQGDVPANQLTRVERGMLLAHKDGAVRQRAEKLFEVDTSSRREVYERYRPALELAGTAAAGTRVYQRECMSCHQVGGQGESVGPNLALTKHRTKEELLLHILDPNREVQPAFMQYTLVDHSGGIHTGLIAAETASSVTLKRDKGVRETILKSEIEELASSEKSLMPEGVEKTIDTQQMADLLAFLVEMHYDIGTQAGRREGDE